MTLVSAVVGDSQCQRLAVKVLRILSEDTSPMRNMREELCHQGAVAALGGVLKAIKPPHETKSFASLPDERQLLLCDAFCALANIFDFIRHDPGSARFTTRSESEQDVLLVNGWWHFVKYLPDVLSILKVSLSSYNVRGATSQLQVNVLHLTKAACRLLASMCPLFILTPHTEHRVVTLGSALYAFELLRDLLKLLVHDLNEVMASRAVQTEFIALL